MKINYGIHELHGIHEEFVDLFRRPIRKHDIAEMACNAFLAEAYELEVTKHGGLDADKIEEYKALCRNFLKESR